jgi:hypothetical protein
MARCRHHARAVPLEQPRELDGAAGLEGDDSQAGERAARVGRCVAHGGRIGGGVRRPSRHVLDEA